MAIADSSLHAPWDVDVDVDVDQMSSDGLTWTLVTAAAGWSKRCAPLQCQKF
jgi:hypothetical protein